MDNTLFVWALLNICCNCIVTTGVVYSILVCDFISDNDHERHFVKTIKAFVLFSLLEMVSSCVVVSMADWGVLPLILLLIAWFMSTFALYHHYQIAYDGETVEHMEKMNLSNIIRSILWVVKFVCMFVFMALN